MQNETRGDDAGSSTAMRDEIAASLNRNQVADLLGVQRRIVTDRHAAGQLYAFRAGPADRFFYPDWQFEHSATIWHLTTVIAQLPAAASAPMIRRWMTTERSDLSRRTPREWLVAGEDPGPVLLAMSYLVDAP